MAVVLYHLPNPASIYAQRTIHNGFKNAFINLGHEFHYLNSSHSLVRRFEEVSPDIFISSTNPFYRKFLNLQEIKKFRDSGTFFLNKLDFWNSPISVLRVNEARSMKLDSAAIKLIKDGLLGDAFFHVVEQDDPRMDGFTPSTGYSFHTIPLAADKHTPKLGFNSLFESDISYIGTNLPDKRKSFRERLYPLRSDYSVKVYGQDWTIADRYLGWAQRFGQYFNLKRLAELRPPKLAFSDEASIYCSSKISLNIHEQYQIKFGGDCNERTFKIPLFNGFQIVDDVECIQKYFEKDIEIVIANSQEDWFSKIEYFIKNPEKRLPIIEAGRSRVLKDHTYENRALQILNIAGLKNKKNYDH